MFCPFCAHASSKVVDKRNNNEQGVIRRRRECLGCKKRYTTYERIERVVLNVEKRNGKVQDFDRNKLKGSIIRATKKLGIEDETIDDLLDDIEHKLLNRKSTTVKSTEIGKLVLSRLKKLNKVAYLRFLSVYREFDSIEKFKKEIQELEAKT